MNLTIASLEAYLADCPGQRDYFHFDTELEAGAWMEQLQERSRADGRTAVVFERTSTKVMAWLPRKAGT